MNTTGPQPPVPAVHPPVPCPRTAGPPSTLPAPQRRQPERNRVTNEYRESEKQRDRDTHATEDSEVPPLAARVTTLQEAVQISLEAGLTDDCLFVFARALKAFAVTTRALLKRDDLLSAFSLWWNTAKPNLPPDADFDEWRFDFLHAFAKAKAPLGANPLEEAIRRARSLPPPPEASRYCTSPGLRRLVAVCYHLQILVGDGPFFLSLRDAARIMGAPKQLKRASAFLGGLVSDRILTEVSRGPPGGRCASRFRFNRSGPPAR